MYHARLESSFTYGFASITIIMLSSLPSFGPAFFRPRLLDLGLWRPYEDVEKSTTCQDPQSLLLLAALDLIDLLDGWNKVAFLSLFQPTWSTKYFLRHLQRRAAHPKNRWEPLSQSDFFSNWEEDHFRSCIFFIRKSGKKWGLLKLTHLGGWKYIVQLFCWSKMICFSKGKTLKR